MQRTATALVALLAALALAGAAGSFDAADGTVPGGGADVTERTGTPLEPERAATPATGESTSAGATSVTDTPAASAGGDGVSPLAAGGFVGALASCVCVAFVLTGDDDRVPRPPRDDGDDDSRPAVSPSYSSPPDTAVVRAWRRLADETDADETHTPTETAGLAAVRGLPRDAVSTLTDRFRAVRYGDAPADDELDGDTAEAVERIREDRP